MINHKIFEIIENDKKYNVLIYTKDDDNDYKFINKFISKHNFCKIIQTNSYYIINISVVTYYENGKKQSQYE